MAEIRVEPKGKAPIWPWIIGILILLGLIWLLIEAFDQDEVYEERIEEREDNDTISSLPANDGQTLALTIYDGSVPDAQKVL